MTVISPCSARTSKFRKKTDIGNLNPGKLAGTRVKVEGYYRGPERFSARELDPRGEGRERVAGRIDKIQKRRGAIELMVMNTLINIPQDVMVEHDLAWHEYGKTEIGALAMVDVNRDEEDRFGDGYWITDNLQIAGQAQLRGLAENENNLNQRDPEDRDDMEASFRARLVYQPSASFFAIGELNYRKLYRNDDDDGRLEDSNSRLGESYFYWIDPFNKGIDLQLGRVDFDDEREWLYDQNLDTVKATWSSERLRLEVSYSETLSDGNLADESAGNSILYLSNRDEDRHIAGYLIHRDFDLAIPLKRTHAGFRASGEWHSNQESWLEVSVMDGQTGLVSNRGWAFDVGNSWRFHDHWSLTAAYAFGQGNDSNSRTDTTFRQTGLHDNNAKFDGVTSFRYYGELVDPELSNLGITTLGLAWLPSSGFSVDLVWHDYQQDKLSTRLTDTDLDMRPNGRNKELGTELDLVMGWRTQKNLDIELVMAWFNPGKAFTNADDAFLAKLQFRYRF